MELCSMLCGSLNGRGRIDTCVCMAESPRCSPDTITTLLIACRHCVCQLVSHVQLFATSWTVALPGSSVHGILEPRILEWVAIPFSRGFAQPQDWIWVSCVAGRFFTIWATREALIQYNTETKVEEKKSDVFITLFAPYFCPSSRAKMLLSYKRGQVNLHKTKVSQFMRVNRGRSKRSEPELLSQQVGNGLI